MGEAGRREIGGAGKAAKKGRIAAARTAEERDPLQRMIKEVIVRYRLYGDSNDTDRWFRLYHEGSGGAVDCFVLSSTEQDKAAKGRLFFKEGGEFKEVKPGGKSTTWKSTLKDEHSDGHEHAHQPLVAAKAKKPMTSHCVWVHEDDCTWYEICEVKASKAVGKVPQKGKKAATKSGRRILR